MAPQIFNRKARYDYTFIHTLTAGIQLAGSEIKSIREGKANLGDSFCVFIDDELFLRNAKIDENKTAYSHDKARDRKLLLNRKELDKLQKELVTGLTIVPYKIFLNERGFAKIEISLARGNKNYDKREAIKKKDIQRETQRNEL